jgi:4-amino-4-deoxy-L-arabinose transferase-like glycosyltransferase
MEHIENKWIEQQSANGLEIKHEGLEYLFLYVFGLYSIPFLIWSAYIFRKPKLRRYIGLAVIILVAVVPALLLNYFFYQAFYHYHN